MELEFRDAISLWLTVKAREQLGPSLSTAIPRYKTIDLNSIIRATIPYPLNEKVIALILTTPREIEGIRQYRHVWPLLSEEEVGTIMKAGAANYIEVSV